MKNLDKIKSEKLFYRIQTLSNNIYMLTGAVQNPDFVNEENAQEGYEIFYNDCKNNMRELRQIKEEVCELYSEIIE